MTSYLRYIHENRPKLAESKSCPPDRIWNQKGREVFKMTKKNTILSEKFAISGSFDKKTIEMGKKNDLKLAEHS